MTHLNAASFAPYFLADGKRIIFASNGNAQVRGETNVFIADWVE